jgi:hypothetical protein
LFVDGVGSDVLSHCDQVWQNVTNCDKTVDQGWEKNGFVRGRSPLRKSTLSENRCFYPFLHLRGKTHAKFDFTSNRCHPPSKQCQRSLSSNKNAKISKFWVSLQKLAVRGPEAKKFFPASAQNFRNFRIFQFFLIFYASDFSETVFLFLAASCVLFLALEKIEKHRELTEKCFKFKLFWKTQHFG